MKTNAYRVIKKEFVDYYKLGDLSNIPNLEGSNFNNGKTVNTYLYDPNQRYLHFFDDYTSAYNYLKETHYDDKDEYCICEFNFDEEFLKATKYQGKYYSQIDFKDVMRDEYIFPVEFYKKENFLKISSPDDYTNRVNYDPDNYDSYDIGSLFGK